MSGSPNACLVTVTITDNEDDTYDWSYASENMRSGTLTIPSEINFIVFVFDQETALTYSFQAPLGMDPAADGSSDFTVSAWSAQCVVVNDAQQFDSGPNTFTLSAVITSDDSESLTGGPEVVNSGDPKRKYPQQSQ